MQYQKFAEELKNKKRSVADLLRYISTRTDNNPNYTLLLGAGCSVTSGIRPASSLIKSWREELYFSCAGSHAKTTANDEEQREYLRQNEGTWYDSDKEYSSLFEKKYDLQRQRRMFIEKEVSNKLPSIGYAYLTSLVEDNFFNTIFTTNFDDLINEAFYLYSDKRPIVCAHDSSINSVTVTSKRPKVIKLHGDYLFDDLKSTIRETETLEQNMKSKFVEFSRDYGLIVAGYSGGDRSIMDILSTILRNEEYFKAGIYWCLRKSSEVPEELRKLIWRDRVFFVEIDGFDELFSELYSGVNNGDTLPEKALSITHRPTEVANRLLTDGKAFPTTNEILRSAREKLVRHSKRTTLADLFFNTSTETGDKLPIDTDLNDDELIQLTEIQNLISVNKASTAIDKAREYLNITSKNKIKSRFYRLMLEAYMKIGDINKAQSVADEIISLNPSKSSNYLLKAELQTNLNKRLNCIDEAIRISPFSVDSYLAKGRLLLALSRKSYLNKSEYLKQADECFSKGIQLDPSSRNPCWIEKFEFLLKNETDPFQKKQKCEEIITKLNEQNPYSYKALRFREMLIDSDDKDAEKQINLILEDINKAKSYISTEAASIFDEIKISLLSKNNNTTPLETEIAAIITTLDDNYDSDLTVTVAKALRIKFGDDTQACSILEKSINYSFDRATFDTLFDAYIDLDKPNDAKDLLNKWRSKLSPISVKRLELNLIEADKDYEKLLNEMSKFEAETGDTMDSHRIYILLKANKYQEAEKQARAILEPIHYTPEAVSETVNLEYARKMNGRSPDQKRLEAVLKFDKAPRTEAAVHAVQGNKQEMYNAITKAISKDKSFIYDARDWPVFEHYRNEDRFIELTHSLTNNHITIGDRVTMLGTRT